MKNIFKITVLLLIVFGNHQITANLKNKIKATKVDISNPIRVEDYGFFDLIVITNSESEHYYDSYILLIKNHKSKNIYRLFEIGFIDIKNRLEKVDDYRLKGKELNDNLYLFKHYMGGNHANSEGSELIKIQNDDVFLIGYYRGFIDIDGDGKDDFYVYVDVDVDSNESYADREYIKKKLIIKNNKFIYPKDYDGPR